MAKHAVSGVSGNTLNDSQLEVLRIGIADLAPALTAFARRFVRNEEDVDDLVQETMLRGLRSLHGFTPGTALKSWLFTILRNTFCTRYKVSKRECVGLPVGIEQTMSTPASQEWRVQHQEVMRAIRDLDKDQKKALLLVAGGTSYSDAAAICGCRVGTIKSRVNRARESLRRNLD
ncbi:sigma-70 family RNA polymerase sigma factor [Rhizobium rhizogenes]|jgi:RNA polymerase sigma-70 factor (ECF subfamily)|uniref:RNA polymerase sigma factor n=2 Tax=Rhizobium/Agrobacterium group TaxID=227290 RepID=A0AAJ4TAT8_AGRTU|nr:MULTISPECIES: sigma-70 family RNA polymerase sigma factor [Rhizobium/Agrobacterium group]MDP9564287.1 RNA polymerase sigma-70 factor (ECF subfamily) [Rhizobium nepotum]ADY67651.1 ECF family sigma factor [Agrobacterium tumefaciens]MEA1844919.1 sigma-70 family RNA polymerase sigma factor [Agrobacterium tumefaciens]MRH98303.1 sigma-70 family RNA polymerase sigma factor [Agrobacterium tumefaciens]NTA45193.1 sigma-70 family RNA polymerase sigma factor [Agrobacterium tumefaciens]